MAGSVDIIVSKEAIADLEKAINKMSQLQTSIVETSRIARTSQTTVSTPSGLNNSTTNNAAITAQIQTQKKAVEDLHNTIVKKAEQSRLAEIRLQQQREKAFDNYDKAQAKEIAKMQASESMYNRLQASMNLMEKTYRDLALRKELGSTLTANEEKNMARLQKKLQEYDRALKAVDATTGKYQRNVGNYASAFNPLSNSINQLTREAPAFAVSMNTGFLAISNNLPIFFDAMKGAIDKNKELQAQGEPTESVLGQLAESIFSVGTALSVGITLLTVYGQEITEWISSLFKGNAALKQLEENNKQFQESRIDGRKESIKDRTELDKYVQIMRNVNLSEEERKIARDKIVSQFPFYFKGLKDEALYNGDITKNLNSLNLALERRGVLQKAQDANIRNKEALVDLKEEQRLNEYMIVGLRKLLKERQNVKLSDDFETAKEQRRITSDINSEYLSSLSKRIELQKTIKRFEEAILTNRKTEILLAGQSIGLEFQEEKARKEAINSLKSINFEMADYLSSRYELIKTQKELEATQFEETYKNESASLTQRLKAYENYISKKTELENDAYAEDLRLNALEVQNSIETERQKLNEFLANDKASSSQKIKARQDFNDFIQSLEKKNAIDLELIELNHANKKVEITKDGIKKQQELIENNIRGIETSRLNQQELDDLRQHQNNLINITKNTSEKQLQKIDEDRTQNSLENQRKRIENDIYYLNEKLTKEVEYTEKRIQLEDQIIAKQKELTNISIAENEKTKKDQEKYISDIKGYLKSFYDEFAGNAGFTELFKILNDEVTGFGENFGVTFNAIAEAAQEAFNFISEASQANFDAEYTRLENQKDIAIGFAGESAAARKDIETQYENRKKEIANRENKAKQKQAIFNIAIDTAQAIMGLYVKPGFPAAIPLAIAVGALGAIQIGAVASQKIPQYFEGGTHFGGLAMINDAKGSNYVETVVTPDGKASQYKGRNVVTDLPAGTEIYTPDQWNDWQKQQLLPMLNSKGISDMPNINIESKGLTYAEMDQIIGKHFANIKTHNTVFDKKGIQSYLQNGTSKTIINNAIVTGSGLKV